MTRWLESAIPHELVKAALDHHRAIDNILWLRASLFFSTDYHVFGEVFDYDWDYNKDTRQLRKKFEDYLSQKVDLKQWL